MISGPGAVCLLLMSTLSVATLGQCAGDPGHEKLDIQPIAGPFVHPGSLQWSHRSQTLYFVDVEQHQICRMNPAAGRVTCGFIANGPVGFLIPIYDSPGQYVVGAGKEFVRIYWTGSASGAEVPTKLLATVDQNREGNRWNNGKVDSEGRFWGGTIGPVVNGQVVPEQASLYRIGKDCRPRVEIDPVTNSNGLAWNLQDDKFYYIDTPTRQIAGYDYEPNSGTISNKRIVFDLNENNIVGYPTGMTIDTDGNLWVAMHGGGQVINVDPRAQRLIRNITIPVENVVSLIYAGPLIDILYVTTSAYNLSTDQRREQPYAGHLFAVKGLGVRGLIPNKFEL